MKTLATLLLAVIAFCLTARGEPAPVRQVDVPVALGFDPYIPEEFDHNDPVLKSKFFRFSKRQRDYMASMEFDEKKFGDYLRTLWPIEKLERQLKNYRPSRLPTQTGYNWATSFSADPYAGLEHKFDTLTVLVFDRSASGTKQGWFGSSFSDSGGSRRDFDRWAWMIVIKKGRIEWSTQSELPNHLFEKKKAEPKRTVQPTTLPHLDPPVKDQPSTPTSKDVPR
jgi:hypothetical protein